MPVRLIFVDDDPFLLQAQRRLLWSVEDWTCTFCDSGEKALSHMEEEPFDVLVSDMRMPMMSGAELSHAVRVRYPRCVRIMLSGQTESGTLCQTFGPSHQFLGKPCPADELRQAVDRSLALRERLSRDDALNTIQQLEMGDIVESRREVIRTSRMPTASRDSVVEPIVSDPDWGAALESIVRRFHPDSDADIFDLEKLLRLVEWTELRVFAAAACVYAHLCEEFTPHTDVVDETLDVAVKTMQKSTENAVAATNGWDATEWGSIRTAEEMQLANLLCNVANLLPFRPEANPQHLSAALLEQLGLPHSVVASVASRQDVEV